MNDYLNVWVFVLFANLKKEKNRSKVQQDIHEIRSLTNLDLDPKCSVCTVYIWSTQA